MAKLGREVWELLRQTKEFGEVYEPPQQDVMRAFIEARLEDALGDWRDKVATVETVAAFKASLAKAMLDDGLPEKLMSSMTEAQRAVLEGSLDDEAAELRKGIEGQLAELENLASQGLAIVAATGVSEEMVLALMFIATANLAAVAGRQLTVGELLRRDPFGMAALLISMV